MYERKYTEAICVKAGEIDGYIFEVGEIYAVLGWNNGVHLVRTTKLGDVKEFVLGHIDGVLQNWGEKNSPEFKEVC